MKPFCPRFDTQKKMGRAKGFNKRLGNSGGSSLMADFKKKTEVNLNVSARFSKQGGCCFAV